MATVTAVTMLALVGVTLAAMASLFAAEARRTRDAQTEAQLRQLLVAGAAVAGARPPSSPTTVNLPPSLAGATLTLRPQPSEANVKVIAIEASWDDRQMTQALRYVRSGDAWRLTSAELNGDAAGARGRKSP